MGSAPDKVEAVEPEGGTGPGGGGGAPPRRVWLRRLAILVGTSVTSLVILVAFREVLVPFVIAVVLAYVLYPAVEWLHRRHLGRRTPPRWVAVLALYAVLLGVLSIFVTTMLPQIGTETASLVRAAPEFFQRVRSEWVPAVEGALGDWVGPVVQQERLERPPESEAEGPATSIRVQPAEGGGYDISLAGDELVVEQVEEGRYRIGPPRRESPAVGFGLQRQIDDAVDRVLAQGEHHAVSALVWTQRAVFLTVEFVFDAVLSLMLAAFILATSPRVMAFFRSLFPPRLRGDFDQVVKRVDGGLSGVIRGQLMICLINGVLSGIGFAIAGLRYWPLLALLATVASIVPIFGTIVSSIPAIAIGLSQGWGTGIFVFVWIVAIHQLEANVLNPKIMGDAAKMHPVLVVFALLAGANTAGVLGALLGVPVMSILQSLFRFLRARAYEEEDCEPGDAECEDGEQPSEAGGA